MPEKVVFDETQKCILFWEVKTLPKMTGQDRGAENVRRFHGGGVQAQDHTDLNSLIQLEKRRD
jgi:hypothetical protein